MHKILIVAAGAVFVFATALTRFHIESGPANAVALGELTKGPSGYYEVSAEVTDIGLRCRYYRFLPRRGNFLTSFVPCKPLSDIAEQYDRDIEDLLFRKALVAELKLATTTMPDRAFVLLAHHSVLDPLKLSPKPRTSKWASSLTIGDRLMVGFLNKRGTQFSPIVQYVSPE